MKNWYEKHKTSSYSNEIAYLRNYLRSGFDPYDFVYKIKDFLEQYDAMKPEWEDLEDDEIFEKWIEIATDNDKKLFEEYIDRHPDKDSFSQPAYNNMSFEELKKPQWLVHFTDDPKSIQLQGFLYGHEDFEGLHLTTWKRNRTKTPGYNFALELGSRNTSNIARKAKYGKHCVIFWGAAVKAYHYGDEENQMIFWGPSIRTDMIFAMFGDRDEWRVPSSERDSVKTGEFEECANWITENYRMLQQIEDKSNRYVKNRARGRL